MSLDRRFSLLFEPVKIGPVTAPNRFYQVPHCTGMGYTHPKTLAAMREVKAEGGWGVVNTEYCSIHPSSDDLPAPFCSLWDDGDVKNMALMTEPNDALWHELRKHQSLHVHRIGDCKAPGLIAHAVYDGHRLAVDFGSEEEPAAPRERVVVL